MLHLTGLAMIGARTGVNWYAQLADKLAGDVTGSRLSWSQAVAAFAVLSIRTGLARNYVLWLAWLRGQDIAVTATQQRQLARVLSDGKLSGQKITAFANAIMGDENAIVLDSHMSRAMMGKVVKWTPTRIAAANRVICSVGELIGLSPRDTQAAIWCAWVKQNGRIKQVTLW